MQDGWRDCPGHSFFVSAKQHFNKFNKFKALRRRSASEETLPKRRERRDVAEETLSKRSRRRDADETLPTPQKACPQRDVVKGICSCTEATMALQVLEASIQNCLTCQNAE